MNFVPPKHGFIFWPVGCGDSTTLCITEDIFFQVDLNHMAQSEEDDCPSAPVVDRLVELLPKKDGRPYLAAFALTHPDLDHCRGFADLQKRVTIGELWFTPRVFTEYHRDLSDDAKAFCKEAKRRVAATIAKQDETKSGDRVRIVGYDDILKESEYSKFPKTRLTVPGNSVTELDNTELDGTFRAFIHAPFKDDQSGERNETSLSFQLELTSGSTVGKALFFGDLAYPTITRIFKETKDSRNLEWDVILAPHHCSKKVMYWQNESGEEEFKQDIMDSFEGVQLDPAWVVASSYPIPDKDEDGDLPPHLKAKKAYAEIANNGFLCTHEHKCEEEPEPIVFELAETGFVYRRGKGAQSNAKSSGLSRAVAAARGSTEPPNERVGFGSGF